MILTNKGFVMKKTILCLFLGIAVSASTLACTGIILHSKNGDVVSGRTMEFGFDVHSNIVVVPAGTKITSLGCNMKLG